MSDAILDVQVEDTRRGHAHANGFSISPVDLTEHRFVKKCVCYASDMLGISKLTPKKMTPTPKMRWHKFIVKLLCRPRACSMFGMSGSCGILTTRGNKWGTPKDECNSRMNVWALILLVVDPFRGVSNIYFVRCPHSGGTMARWWRRWTRVGLSIVRRVLYVVHERLCPRLARWLHKAPAKHTNKTPNTKTQHTTRVVDSPLRGLCIRQQQQLFR